jgi:SNF2 family DNA or RNA helicase
LKKFKEEFDSENPGQVQDKLKAQVSPFILRRKKSDVLIELPDKQEQITYCSLNPLQEKMYLQILDNVKKRYLSDPNDINRYYIHVLAALTRLRQVCNHPRLVDKDIRSDQELSGKVELLQEIIGDAVAGGKKLLIFSQFVEMLKMLKELLNSMKISYEYLDGNTKNRRKCIDNFNKNIHIKTFLISLKTGGFGINLIAADTVILVDPWWNPMGENQAVDRAHRIGQTKKVNVYKIITRGTIEEKILQLQQNKREMFESLIDDGQNFLKRLTKDQLHELLEYS